jgi:acyl-coenzyme A thioesterase PaaI-like protein
MILEWFQYFQRIPFFGPWIFNWLVSFNSPYTGSIPMHIQSLSVGKCASRMRDSFFVRNPFKCIHAVALMNLGEATSGLAVLTWAEKHKYRAIVTKIECEYFQKARGTITAVCQVPPEMTADGNLKLPVDTDMFNSNGTLVAKARIHWTLSLTKQVTE